MRKLGFLCLMLVLALGAMGGGLAYFSDTATVSTTFTAGLWQTGIRAFVACGANPQVKVEPRWEYWEAPGVANHSFTVTMVQSDCGGHSKCGHPLSLLYLVRNEGNIPMKLDSINIVTPDWIKMVRYGCHVPKADRGKIIAEIEALADIPDDIKQSLIDPLGRNWQQDCILEPGPEWQPGTWGLIYVWLHITEEAPENTPGTVTVSPVFNIWQSD